MCEYLSLVLMTDSKVARNLEVLIVRHGESENNIIMEEVFARTYAQPFSSEEFQKADKEWLARRSEDPSLSAKGMAEAEQFAHANVPKLLEAVGPTGCVHIFVSPLLRTCQTAWPLVKLLGSEHCKVEVRPDIYEVGGVYTEVGGEREGSGKCLSAEDIESRFPGYDTSALISGPRSSGWYTGNWESDSEGRERAASVASWLKTPNLCIQCSSPGSARSPAVLVVHAHFTDLLLKALMGIKDDPAHDLLGTNRMVGRNVAFMTPNTAMTQISIRSGNVSLHSFGNTDHLQQTGTIDHGKRSHTSHVFLSGLAVGLIGAYFASIRMC